MVRKKLDNRIRVLLENCVITGHRSMFVVVGDKGRDQVVILHHILSKASYKARPNVLWCYKKELGFSSHRKKRMKQVQKKIKSGNLNANEDDPFELFIASTQIRYCYYSETHKILGNTFGMCVLQDFEALTPNLLARTIETVEGGGCVVILLRSVSSLRQLYTMAMDVHTRYRTESHQDIVGRFNERFILSLSNCRNCMVVDDQLNILPISTHILNIEAVPLSKKDEIGPNDAELKQLKESLRDTQPVGVLINCCKTLDQAKAVLKFIDVITEKTLRSTVALTAARGRGKSAALGLAMAGAVAFGYSNIFVTSPSPENLSTLFEFVFKGFDVLEYQEHIDYELIQSTNPEFNKAIVRVNIFREHRQTIQYIHPADAAKLGQAELVVIDEAAAIPLPLVRELMGPYLVFMSSTINGYEGTGRSLSLKLIQQLREQTLTNSSTKSTSSGNEKQIVGVTGRQLHEIVLEESIRYKPGDDVEKWLNGLLCLEVANVPKLMSGCPIPQDCDLYYINRDTLFCYHKASELFLQRLMSIYVAAHYKNSPNDLQLLSDAPAHHLFCLLGPVNPNQKSLPEVLCVLQICLEGEISKTSVINSLARGKRSAGDLIPWTVAQQFQDDDFPSLSGARVVRIATHPDYQSMGYGSRALELLQDYYEGKIQSIAEEEEKNGDKTEEIDTINAENFSLLEESVAPRKNLPPLLLKLSERKPERLDYLGVSFGLTSSLLKFWKKNSYVPVYLRQTPNELTGEHTCIMIRSLRESRESQWLRSYWKDFRRRFVHLLGYQFRKFSPGMCINLLHQKQFDSNVSDEALTKAELDQFLTGPDMKRLELYSQNLVDYHLITDLMPTASQLIFRQKIDIQLSAVQQAIMLAVGLQFQSIDDLVKILDLPATQLLALFNRAVRRLVQHLNGICEKEVEAEMGDEQLVVMNPTAKSLQEDLDEAADEFTKETRKKERKEQLDESLGGDLSQFAIRGDDSEWSEALLGGKKNPGGIISVKSNKLMEKRSAQVDLGEEKNMGKAKKKQKRK